jgi:arsenate reductase (thioredoxin)
MTRATMKVLFLCTGNSARSIFAESFLRRLGAQFEAYSAGSHPKGAVHPTTLEVLRTRFGIDASDARSKSWDELKDVRFDFVITVCDQARESCPVWPGQPIVAHWGVEDPAAFVGTDAARERYFHAIALQMHRRVQIFCALPLEKLDRLRTEQLVKGVGTDPEGVARQAELPPREPPAS